MYFGGGGGRVPRYNTPALEMYFMGGGGVVFTARRRQYDALDKSLDTNQRLKKDRVRVAVLWSRPCSSACMSTVMSTHLSTSKA